jgi:hypothetical protein
MAISRKFSNYLEANIGSSEADLKMKHQILNVCKIMQKHESFTKQSVQNQFGMCVTIIRIAVNTSMDDLSRIRLIGDEKTFEYSIYNK